MRRAHLLTLALAATAALTLTLRPEPAQAGPGVAVLELFTSEGCSSCPPADRLLREATAKAQAEGLRVVPLAWHVDYWDRLGWPDPYASPRHTARQQAYARTLGARGLYTPQLVVDGTKDVVGSRGAAVASALRAATVQADAVPVTAQVTREGARWTVRWQAPGATVGAVALVALTDSGLTSAVPRGENAGATLRHDHVVRAFAQREAKRGQLTLAAPAGALQRPRIVVVIQHPAGAVLGAWQQPRL